MLRVPMNQVRAGMTLASAVMNPKAARQALLKKDHVLDDPVIRRMSEMGIREVWIRYPSLEFIGKYVSPSVLAQQAAVQGQIADAFDAASEGAFAKLDWSSYRSSVRSMLDKLIDDPEAAIFMHEMVGDDDLLRHSTSVCMISLLMGLKLGGYLVSQRKRLNPDQATDVVNLGVGAMLHDIGVRRLPAHVVEKWRSSGEENDPEYRRHVTIGYKIVQGRVDPTAAATVLHHHQKFDGSGFPMRRGEDGVARGLAGFKIHVFPRIVSAANIFDRLRNPLDGSARIPTVRALRRLREEPYCDWIDPMTYRALLAVAPPYAPGSLVTLNTGEMAVVTDFTTADPCRPTVQVIRSLEDMEDGRVGPTWDLTRRQDLEIAGSEGHDVLRDNFYARHADELDIHAAEARAVARGVAEREREKEKEKRVERAPEWEAGGEAA